jgi:hypothetical protein
VVLDLGNAGGRGGSLGTEDRGGNNSRHVQIGGAGHPRASARGLGWSWDETSS